MAKIIDHLVPSGQSGPHRLFSVVSFNMALFLSAKGYKMKVVVGNILLLFRLLLINSVSWITKQEDEVQLLCLEKQQHKVSVGTSLNIYSSGRSKPSDHTNYGSLINTKKLTLLTDDSFVYEQHNISNLYFLIVSNNWFIIILWF